MANWVHHETETSVGRTSWWESNPAPEAATARETVVLLHGFSDDATCFHPFAEAARWTEQYRVITPDAVGHGGTPLREAGSDLGHNVTELHDLLAAANVEQILLMGHSMGAIGASLYAQAHPDRTRAVVLEDPVWRMNEDLTRDRRPADGSDHPLIAWVKGVQKLSARNRKRLAVLENRSWSDAELEAWAQSKARTDSRLFDGPVRWSPHPWWDTAEALTMPTLLLTGDPNRGAIVNEEAATFALARMPKGERTHFASATHTIRRDHTVEVADAVNNFFVRVRTTGSQ